MFTVLGSTTGALTYTDSTVAPNDLWWYAATATLPGSCETAYSNEIVIQVPPASGDVMYWDATGEWIAKSPSPPIQVQSGPVGPPKTGDVLMWLSASGSGRWMPRTPITPIRSVTNYTTGVINGIPVGNIIVWNGSKWAAKTPVTPVRKGAKK
jgi:hypothetical protein